MESVLGQDLIFPRVRVAAPLTLCFLLLGAVPRRCGCVVVTVTGCFWFLLLVGIQLLLAAGPSYWWPWSCGLGGVINCIAAASKPRGAYIRLKMADGCARQLV